MVWNNLRNSFPEKSLMELKKIENDFYSHLCDVIVETIKLLSISEKELKNRVSHENPELLSQICQNGGSFISLAGHIGNWEWLLAANKVYLNCNVDAVYKPLSSPFFEKLMLKIRSRFGTFPVSSLRVLRIEAGRKEIPRGIAMVADQTAWADSAYAIHFLNQATLFFTGPKRIAELFSYPIFYAGLKKTGRGRYHFFIEQIASPPFPKGNFIIETFARKLEKQIQENPAIWLWSHKRWKHEVPTELLTNAGKTY